MIIDLSNVAIGGFYLQAIVGVAGGATRAALTQHQARRNNMADVSAKDGSQVNTYKLLIALLECLSQIELRAVIICRVKGGHYL